MDDTDLEQTQSLLTLYRLQLSQLGPDDPLRDGLEIQVKRLQALISPPPPPKPLSGEGLIPPFFRQTKVNIDRNLNSEVLDEAWRNYNEGKDPQDQIELDDFIKLRKGQLTLYFRAYYYCGSWFAAPPKNHLAWNDFVAFAGQDVADRKDLYDYLRVE